MKRSAHVIDCGVGNVGSVAKMLEHIGAKVVRATEPAHLTDATHVILPGVGAFDHGAAALSRSGFRSELQQAVAERRFALLGICLGAQLLMEGSEEGDLAGLGVVKGRSKRFPPKSETGLPVPNMGWRFVDAIGAACPLFQLDEPPRYYFTHSYHMDCEDPSQVAATASYGIKYVAAIASDRCVGVQFHPEKSHFFGAELLKRFVGW